jgi:hypothetical protein
LILSEEHKLIVFRTARFCEPPLNRAAAPFSLFGGSFTLFASFADGRGNCNRSVMLSWIFPKLDRRRKPGNRSGLS